MWLCMPIDRHACMSASGHVTMYMHAASGVRQGNIHVPRTTSCECVGVYWTCSTSVQSLCSNCTVSVQYLYSICHSKPQYLLIRAREFRGSEPFSMYSAETAALHNRHCTETDIYCTGTVQVLGIRVALPFCAHKTLAFYADTYTATCREASYLSL